MSEQPLPLDWAAIDCAALHARRLLAYLREHVPPARWGEAQESGFTLLHYACFGDTDAVVELLSMDWT